MTDAAPVLDHLRTAAPSLSSLARRAGPLADAAAPALDRLGRAARTGGPILRRARPAVAALRVFAREARPTGILVAELFGSLREKGVVEGLQNFVYYAAQATARYDQYSHIIPAHLIGSECSTWARTTVPDCEAHFAGGGARARAERRARSRRAPRRDGRSRRSAPTRDRERPAPGAAREPGRAGGGEAPRPDDQRPRLPELPELPELPPLPPVEEPGDAAEELLDFLLGGDDR
jgi:hypothetical protein